ncbi:hypothetical protein A2U01_0081956, partial [Trifolium medium]|nr:hypothetical protein [Trifolium medium]
EHLTRCFSRAPPNSPTSGIRAVVRLGGGAGVNPGIGSTIGCENSHLGEIVEFQVGVVKPHIDYEWEEC